MFKSVEDYLKNFLINCDKEVCLESCNNYGDNKLEIVLTTKDFWASISILTDFTYDFYVLDVETEEMLLIKTLNPNSLEELFVQMDSDLREYLSLER